MENLASWIVGAIRALINQYPSGAAFNTYFFLAVFLPIALTGYWIFQSRRWKLFWLTVMSGIFYSLYDIRFTGLLFVAALVDYGIARWMEPTTGETRKLWLATSVTFNLTLLAFFKYAMFAESTAQSLLSLLHIPYRIPGIIIVLPVGISFFTFKTMSYTIDVYRGEVRATRSLLKYTAFVAMFPELVAGPIVRYQMMDHQMDDIPTSLPRGYIVTGVSLFILGLAKKVLVADLIATAINPLWDVQWLHLSTAQAWTAVLGYTLQIYFDFSGYSDMAIGLAALLGFVFPINFLAPYKSRNPSEFWQRWHITLSTFLRDYLYIPLGGGRGGTILTARNLLIVMLLGGLWHGAAWAFVLWGAYHGVLLVVYHATKRWWDAAPRALQVGGTFTLVSFGWVPFRAVLLDKAVPIYHAMLHPVGGPSIPWVQLAWGMLLLLFVFWAKPNAERVFQPTFAWAAWLALLFVSCVVAMGSHYSPFLYYQF